MSHRKHSCYLHRYLTLVLLILSISALPTASAAQTGITDQDISSIDWAAESGDLAVREKNQQTPSATILFFRMLGALALVLAIMIAIAWLFRRFIPGAQAATGRTDAIRIISTKMLGNRRSLVLVRVRGQTLLLGVTPQTISALTEIHEMEGEWAQSPDLEKDTKPATAAFEKQLGKYINETLSPELEENSPLQ